jgi:hypothetical protein
MQRNSVAMRQSPDSVDSETYPRQSESNSGCLQPSSLILCKILWRRRNGGKM